ncbi:unnamed protein product [Cuscuta epithymum]|uniref:Uncharacterized protein n=1 Tax=Cuscuta epithymum TaxID=186058 RepID=A0AAV0EFH3_9ASTE|nr:unnamed protein product [Cuscuta epithymum]
MEDRFVLLVVFGQKSQILEIQPIDLEEYQFPTKEQQTNLDLIEWIFVKEQSISAPTMEEKRSDGGGEATEDGTRNEKEKKRRRHHSLLSAECCSDGHQIEGVQEAG